jgi:two-component system, chemotaxis family, protein-glutamate methylesterase/glutaminase
MTHKPVRVMIVDDSAVVRGLMNHALSQDENIQVTSSAGNGAIAVRQLKQTPADVILLDVEMPEMNGLEALPLLMQIKPDVKIIMVSSLTTSGGDITMKALDQGASDCVPKPSAQDKTAVDNFYREIRLKVLALGGHPSASTALTAARAAEQSTSSPAAKAAPTVASAARSKSGMLPGQPIPIGALSRFQCIAIGSSTGGPQALMHIFKALKGAKITAPILITQHMPKTFTQIMAKHLSEAGSVPCVEAADGMVAQPGHAYVAPGDYHLVPVQQDGKLVMKINQEPPINYCRPAVDPMFEALAEIYNDKLLAIVLTGMGQDGLDGAKEVVSRKGVVIAQEEKSCVVWGMPKAVSQAGIASDELDLDQIAQRIRGVTR